MFWKVPCLTQPSPIETILDKEDYTLEELLDEDELVQECKALNGRLIAFLREKSTVEQLVRYLIEADDDTENSKKVFKYPYTACEIFCCDVEAVFDTLLGHKDLMALLFSLLEKPAPLNAMLAGYFARVVSMLIVRKPADTVEYLQAHMEVLGRLVSHLETASVAEIIFRLVGAEEQAAVMFTPQDTQWLVESDLLPLLVERLGPGQPAAAQAHAAEVLAAVAHSQPSPLTSQLTKPAYLRSMLESALAPDSSALVPALNVCIALLEPKRSVANEYGIVPTELQPVEVDRSVTTTATAEIIAFLDPLVALLEPTDPEQTQDTTYGMLQPPLGCARLKVVELLSALLATGEAAAHEALMKAGAIRACTALFTQYPFNNLLHHGVLRMLTRALDADSEPLVAHMFDDCGLLDWIIGAPNMVMPLPRSGTNGSAGSRPPLRAGYHGHLTSLANALVTRASESPDLEARLSGHAGWVGWLARVVAPRNDVENVARWACGRPASADLSGADSDGDDFGADLDLDALGSFGGEHQHRYAAYADDDDDDDDRDSDDDDADDSDDEPIEESGLDEAGSRGADGDPYVASALKSFGTPHIVATSSSSDEEDDADAVAPGGGDVGPSGSADSDDPFAMLAMGSTGSLPEVTPSMDLDSGELDSSDEDGGDDGVGVAAAEADGLAAQLEATSLEARGGDGAASNEVSAAPEGTEQTALEGVDAGVGESEGEGVGEGVQQDGEQGGEGGEAATQKGAKGATQAFNNVNYWKVDSAFQFDIPDDV